LKSEKIRPEFVQVVSGGPKRVLIVDDHPLVREGIAALIRATPSLEVSAEVGSAEEAFESIAKDPPDLVLLDISLPGKSGLDFIKELHVINPNIYVLVLSMHEETVYAERALRVGAYGYIMKQEPSEKVIEAIQRVLCGEFYVSPSIASHLLKQYVQNGQGSDTCSCVERLSNRELQVFVAIGKGQSTQEVADKFSLSVKTVQTYREHIKRKLGLRNATDLVYNATQWVASEAGVVCS